MTTKKIYLIVMQDRAGKITYYFIKARNNRIMKKLAKPDTSRSNWILVKTTKKHWWDKTTIKLRGTKCKPPSYKDINKKYDFDKILNSRLAVA
ncbi:MAG TPA: hypothetical protein P5060_01835 [Candidatus Absconditabacterales bacterium]|nr:hypothetical protein [Candidatus Absconditabacterales bacterium]